MPGKPKYVAEETKEYMVELRNLGKSCRQISEEVDIPRERVRQILLSLGLPAQVPITLDLFSYSHVDVTWMAEFRGFFMGEGCVSMWRNLTFRHMAKYNLRLDIHARLDDLDLVRDIQGHLGGSVVIKDGRENSQTKANCNWQLVGWSRLTNLLPILLDGVLPAKKRRDLAIANELCQKRLTWPYNLREKHVAEISQYYEALKAIKRFQGSEG